MTEYALVRSRRKSLAIHITKEASVEVRAPQNYPKAGIDRFVASRQDWIERQLNLRRQSLKRRNAFALNYGSLLSLQGGTYKIAEAGGSCTGFDGDCLFLPSGLTADEIKQAVVRAYREAAKKLLTEKTAQYAAHMGLAPAAVRINGAKSRWGSCSGKGSINFSWRLVMAEDTVIDYVVVHELSHLRELNHSKAFWAVVSAVLPDYKARREKLRAFQQRLEAENWD